eukprot:Trichotokara_eunicae@DN7684_c0_g1_i1.p1
MLEKEKGVIPMEKKETWSVESETRFIPVLTNALLLNCEINGSTHLEIGSKPSYVMARAQALGIDTTFFHMISFDRLEENNPKMTGAKRPPHLLNLTKVHSIYLDESVTTEIALSVISFLEVRIKNSFVVVMNLETSIEILKNLEQLK